MTREADIRRAVLLQGDRARIDVQSVRDAVQSTGVVVDDPTISSLAAAMSADLRGLGPLEPFLTDPTVTDIAINGAAEVWVDRGEGMRLTRVRFRDDMSVRRMAQRLATSCGRRLDDACPYVDAPLPDGIRLHAVLPPLVDRISVSIRVPRHRAWTLDDLATVGTVPPPAVPLLRELVLRQRAFLVSGGTGSGKTTLLNALLGTVASGERVVIVEDTRELAPRHPHVVLLQTRAPNIEGAGAVSMQMLVRQTLRMRPDRIVIGEVRGAEVIDLLTALNTGQRGGCGTIHANSASDVGSRLEALAALGGVTQTALTPLVTSALDAVVHLTRDPSGVRRLSSIAVVRRDAGAIHVEPALNFDERGEMHPTTMAESFHSLVRPR